MCLIHKIYAKALTEVLYSSHYAIKQAEMLKVMEVIY
jgi:hypothetical protein